MNWKMICVGDAMKLYAICYGKGFKYGTKGSVFKDCDNPNEILENFVFLYYIAEVGNKLIYIDTGFRDKVLAEKMGITLLHVGEEIQQVFGRRKPDIVLITHAHWDHINNLDMYQDAEIIISKQSFSTILEYIHISDLVKKMDWDSFTTVENQCDIEGTFRFEVIGGHTPDSSIITFQANDKKYVITGDECYVCENLTNQIGIGIYFDSGKNDTFIRRMKKEDRIPLTFHDSGVLERGKGITEHIVQVI